MNSKVDENNPTESPFDKAILSFFSDLESLHTSHMIVATILIAAEVQCRSQLKTIVDGHTSETTREDGTAVKEFPDLQYFALFRELGTDLKRTLRSSELVRRGVVVNMVSQFDAFIGQLIRAMYLRIPEKLNSSERTVTLSQLLKSGSIGEVVESLMEKEVESVLRMSHIEQFAWLEKVIDAPLRKDLPSWQPFVEITERRNLFVHTDGRVSEQYIKTCESQGVTLPPDCDEGVELTISKEYIDLAYNTLVEIGVKLGQVMWRKLVSKEQDDADINLNTVAIELIKHHEYDLAEKLLDFSSKYCSNKMNEKNKLNMILNQAQNLKWSSRNEECLRLLSTIDWSAKSGLYQLANAVLIDEYGEAQKHMLNIGSGLSKLHYVDWPIFREFRKTNQFAIAYKNIFGAEYVDVKDSKSLYAMARSIWKTDPPEALIAKDVPAALISAT